MDCEEFRELAPAFALGALEEPERADCAAHLAGDRRRHQGCAEALAEAQAVAAQLASLLPRWRPRSRVWEAIQLGVMQTGRMPRAQRRVWRELSGWFVAAAVLGLYLYNAPVDSARKADAAVTAPPAMRLAAALLMNEGTRHYVFHPRLPGPGRGSLILNRTERSAVVMVDRVALEPGLGLRLWAARSGGGAPVLLTRLSAGIDGMATAEVSETLFEPAQPEELWLSIDPQDAAAPRSVLLAAQIDGL
jgi:hypothetical protein